MEFLEKVLGEELYKQFEAAVKAHNENPNNKGSQVKVANLSDGQYVDKGKYDTAVAERDNLEGQAKILNTTIETLKKDNQGNETLQTTITTLQGELKNQQMENEKITKTFALKEQLSRQNVIDPDYLIYKAGGIEKFNFDKDGKPIGVEDITKPYKEDTAFSHLFKAEQQKPPYTPKGGVSASTGNPFAKETYNLTRQGQLLTENPAQAQELAAAVGIKIQEREE